MNLREFQREHGEWVAQTFREQPHSHLLLGILEEAGELAHSFLKDTQGIPRRRGSRDEQQQDAVGDLALYLLALCEAKGWDLETILESTSRRVRARAWRKREC